MYECCNVRRFFRLLLLDAMIFSILSGCFLIGRLFLSSAAMLPEEPVKLPVIMYHSVCDRTPSDYLVTPAQLESDLKALRESGYTSVTAAQLCSYVRGRGILPEKPVLITLDDGFYNNLSEVLPLLERYDMHAVVSVVGSYTDYNAAAYPHDSGCSYMTWEDIRTIAASGRVEIGSHTYDMHSIDSGRQGCARLKWESAEDYTAALEEDISQLQLALHSNAGLTPFVFAYPFGAVSRESLPVLRENGILMTLTCRELINDLTHDPDCLYGLGRFNRSGLYSTEQFMKLIGAE